MGGVEPPSWRGVEGVDEEEIMTIQLSPVGHLSWRFIRATFAFAFAFAPSSTTFKSYPALESGSVKVRPRRTAIRSKARKDSQKSTYILFDIGSCRSYC